MARHRNTRGRNWLAIILAAVFLSACILITLAEHFELPFNIPTWEEVGNLLERWELDLNLPTGSGGETLTAEGEMAVHYIDVKQADSILIQCGGENVLIDAGESSTAQELIAYLEDQGVETIDLLIATHPHADHIGGMYKVVDHFEVKEVLMPEIPDNLTPTTKAYTNLLLSISKKDVALNLAEVGKRYKIGEAVLEILGPTAVFDDLNENSIVARVTHGAKKFLFTGDMETNSEKGVLAEHDDISADVLKIAHHGSSTSSLQSFLNAVDPSIAVIPCGAGNDYGHPHKETMEKLNDMDLEIYRTDLNGTVVIVSDGESLRVDTEK